MLTPKNKDNITAKESENTKTYRQNYIYSYTNRLYIK